MAGVRAPKTFSLLFFLITQCQLIHCLFHNTDCSHPTATTDNAVHKSATEDLSRPSIKHGKGGGGGIRSAYGTLKAADTLSQITKTAFLRPSDGKGFENEYILDQTLGEIL